MESTDKLGQDLNQKTVNGSLISTIKGAAQCHAPKCCEVENAKPLAQMFCFRKLQNLTKFNV